MQPLLAAWVCKILHQRRRKPMTKHSVSCVATSHVQAETIIDCFEASNFANHEISVRSFALASNHGRDFGCNTETPTGVMAGAGIGCAIAGMLGWMVGSGALPHAGAVPFIVAGPLLSALGGAATGGITGGVIGGGVAAIDTRQHGATRRPGSYMISVCTRSRDEISRVAEIFSDAGAEEISLSGEADTLLQERDAPAGRSTAMPAVDSTTFRYS